VIFDDTYDPTIGSAITVRKGNDVSIIATGVMVARTLDAAHVLQELGLDAEVIEMHTVKPLDEEAIKESASRTGSVVTVEEHSVIGGLCSSVAEILCEELPTPLIRVGVADRLR